MTPDDKRHGTVAGYGQHHKTATLPACKPCKAAMARYQNKRVLREMRGERATVPAVGTIRRIQALVCMGWSMPTLSERLGAARPQTIQNLARKPHDAQIRVATAEKIRGLYDELSMLHGPNRVGAARAITKGWAPPLAWDDIDNPHEKPTGFKVCGAPDCADEIAYRGLCRRHYRAEKRAA